MLEQNAGQYLRVYDIQNHNWYLFPNQKKVCPSSLGLECAETTDRSTGKELTASLRKASP
jgi:hypothetical protein